MDLGWTRNGEAGQCATYVQASTAEQAGDIEALKSLQAHCENESTELQPGASNPDLAVSEALDFSGGSSLPNTERQRATHSTHNT